MMGIFAKENRTDALVAIAIIALIVIAFRQTTVDLAGFGEGILGILGGRSAHTAAAGWAAGQTAP